MDLETLKTKKVIILGFGREGVDTFKFLRRLFPKKTLAIADKLTFEKLNKKVQKLILYPSRSKGWGRTNVLRDEKCSRRVKLYLGKNYLKAIKKYDIIIKSPGIPFKILPRSVVGNLDKITTQTEIFFENCPGKIVGITGTKGKSTTASLIYKILKEGGIKAHLVGNIGKPVLNLLFSAIPDVYVYELSSHQLSNLKKSPQIAVFLNIYPEHLDYYRNFREYIRAKANITKYQTKRDFLIYNSTDRLVTKIAKKSKAKRIPIRGEYYSLDKAAAKAVGKMFKVPSKIIDKTIKNLKHLPHRLELVGIFKGITFYNDALATIPEATIGALDTLGDKVETIMLGGYERNIDFKNLAKRVLKSKIKTVILFPSTGEKIWKEILRHGRNREVPKNFFIDNMREAVKLAYRYTGKGKICLLSCASPSFSIFRDYKEKGNLFKKQVRALAKEGGTKVEMKE